MSEGWKKWECPPDMFTVEERLKTLQLTDDQTDRLSLAYYDMEMQRTKDSDMRQKWAALYVKTQAKIIKKDVKESFVKDFQLWLQGRSKYCQPTITVPIKEKDGRTTLSTRTATPWGNKGLLHLPEVCDWLKKPVLNRDRVIKKVAELNLMPLNTIEDCWLYYKYITRAVAVDGDIIKEQRDFNVFDYIEQAPTKVVDGKIVSDPRYKPLSMDNPSMPKFDKEEYGNIYNACIIAGAAGETQIVNTPEYNDLMPSDKLMVLSVLAESGKIKPSVYNAARTAFKMFEADYLERFAEDLKTGAAPKVKIEKTETAEQIEKLTKELGKRRAEIEKLSKERYDEEVKRLLEEEKKKKEMLEKELLKEDEALKKLKAASELGAGDIILEASLDSAEELKDDTLKSVASFTFAAKLELAKFLEDPQLVNFKGTVDLFDEMLGQMGAFKETTTQLFLDYALPQATETGWEHGGTLFSDKGEPTTLVTNFMETFINMVSDKDGLMSSAGSRIASEIWFSKFFNTMNELGRKGMSSSEAVIAAISGLPSPATMGQQIKTAIENATTTSDFLMNHMLSVKEPEFYPGYLWARAMAKVVSGYNNPYLLRDAFAELFDAHETAESNTAFLRDAQIVLEGVLDRDKQIEEYFNDIAKDGGKKATPEFLSLVGPLRHLNLLDLLFDGNEEIIDKTMNGGLSPALKSIYDKLLGPMKRPKPTTDGSHIHSSKSLGEEMLKRFDNPESEEARAAKKSIATRFNILKDMFTLPNEALLNELETRVKEFLAKMAEDKITPGMAYKKLKVISMGSHGPPVPASTGSISATERERLMAAETLLALPPTTAGDTDETMDEAIYRVPLTSTGTVDMAQIKDIKDPKQLAFIAQYFKEAAETGRQLGPTGTILEPGLDLTSVDEKDLEENEEDVEDTDSLEQSDDEEEEEVEKIAKTLSSKLGKKISEEKLAEIKKEIEGHVARKLVKSKSIVVELKKELDELKKERAKERKTIERTRTQLSNTLSQKEQDFQRIQGEIEKIKQEAQKKIDEEKEQAKKRIQEENLARFNELTAERQKLTSTQSELLEIRKEREKLFATLSADQETINRLMGEAEVERRSTELAQADIVKLAEEKQHIMAVVKELTDSVADLNDVERLANLEKKLKSQDVADIIRTETIIDLTEATEKMLQLQSEARNSIMAKRNLEIEKNEILKVTENLQAQLQMEKENAIVKGVDIEVTHLEQELINFTKKAFGGEGIPFAELEKYARENHTKVEQKIMSLKREGAKLNNDVQKLNETLVELAAKKEELDEVVLIAEEKVKANQPMDDKEKDLINQYKLEHTALVRDIHETRMAQVEAKRKFTSTFTKAETLSVVSDTYAMMFMAEGKRMGNRQLRIQGTSDLNLRTAVFTQVRHAFERNSASMKEKGSITRFSMDQLDIMTKNFEAMKSRMEPFSRDMTESERAIANAVENTISTLRTVAATPRRDRNVPSQNELNDVEEIKDIHLDENMEDAESDITQAGLESGQFALPAKDQAIVDNLAEEVIQKINIGVKNNLPANITSYEQKAIERYAKVYGRKALYTLYPDAKYNVVDRNTEQEELEIRKDPLMMKIIEYAKSVQSGAIDNNAVKEMVMQHFQEPKKDAVPTEILDGLETEAALIKTKENLQRTLSYAASRQGSEDANTAKIYQAVQQFPKIASEILEKGLVPIEKQDEDAVINATTLKAVENIQYSTARTVEDDEEEEDEITYRLENPEDVDELMESLDIMAGLGKMTVLNKPGKTYAYLIDGYNYNKLTATKQNSSKFVNDFFIDDFRSSLVTDTREKLAAVNTIHELDKALKQLTDAKTNSPEISNLCRAVSTQMDKLTSHVRDSLYEYANNARKEKHKELAEWVKRAKMDVDMIEYYNMAVALQGTYSMPSGSLYSTFLYEKGINPKDVLSKLSAALMFKVTQAHRIYTKSPLEAARERVTRTSTMRQPKRNVIEETRSVFGPPGTSATRRSGNLKSFSTLRGSKPSTA